MPKRDQTCRNVPKRDPVGTNGTRRYGGVSTCFRKEAGAHGKDTWGIFRVHQFEKVEQFCICEGDLEKSAAMQEEMVSEPFFFFFRFARRYLTGFLQVVVVSFAWRFPHSLCRFAFAYIP